MSEAALQRIAENKLTQNPQLDLSGLDLSHLPDQLADCAWLESLDISHNPELADLTPLAGLTQLQQLYCYDTQASDLTPLAGLTHLQYLNCTETQISDLTPLAGLTQLQRVACSSTQINDLTPLAGLAQLRQLFCYRTQINDLTPLAGLNQLQHLDCYGTKIGDLTPLTGLNNLKKLDVGLTEIADLSPLRGLIQNGIDVHWNSEEFFGNDSVICIEDCPLVCPPAEIARDSPQAVRDYFDELGDDGELLNEVKVIFLGEASAGKTSLVKRLMNKAFDSRESQTHGIRIRQAGFDMSDGEQVTAHLWDFGGQEVMHATHQFFLSQRSVYVLLLNSRNDDQTEKWLKHADSFGGRSPVLVVLNKIDENPSFEVERKSLSEKYPRITGFYRLSCAQDEHPGFIEFREALRRQIEQADTRCTPFPAHWLAVKRHFVAMQKSYDYIESAEYRRVCQELGVTRRLSQDVLLQFLHDLGVLINFRDLQYFDTQILNPLWLTNGVYRIINSSIVAEQGGLLRERDFDAVINDPRYQSHNSSEREFIYPKDKLCYIVRVMQEFELCFPIGPSDFIVPQLLPANAPEFAPDGAVLRFVMHFPAFLPNSIFPRLMVKLHDFIRGNERWRTGMVLHKASVFDALARVRWDKEDQQLLIDICGNERRRLLSFIRETVKEIVADFTGLEFEERVPVPDCNGYKDYDELVEAEKARETEIFVKELKRRIPIASLLDGIEEAAMRDENRQLPVKAFVSYSHQDLAHLKSLRSHLSPLIRLQKLQLWDDRDIEAGEEWLPEILQQLEQADIVLCLVSPDFVNSDFCYLREFQAALDAHRCGEKSVVPIMLRKTDWQDLPLAAIQGAPGEWISAAADQDGAWCRVSERLRPVIEAARERKVRKLEAENLPSRTRLGTV